MAFSIAVNARTGKLVPGFAKEGELDLKPGMKAPELRERSLRIERRSGDLQESGVHRIALAGLRLLWWARRCPRLGCRLPGNWSGHSTRFRNREKPGHETWLTTGKYGWKNRSGVNVWNTFTVDAETGTLLMPIGVAQRRSLWRRPARRESVRQLAGRRGRDDREK